MISLGERNYILKKMTLKVADGWHQVDSHGGAENKNKRKNPAMALEGRVRA